MQGLEVLQEIPGELGVLLWRTLRTATLWASVGQGERADLFQPGSETERAADLVSLGLDKKLEAAIGVITALLSRPESGVEAQIEAACARIADWAAENGYGGTRMEFTLAATLASPAEPEPALAAAQAARDRGDFAMAEAWYQRGVALARQKGDWETYSRAYIGLGRMWKSRGAFPAARRALLKAVRAATRRAQRELKALALHDLFTVEVGLRRPDEASRLARAAVRAYPQGYPTVPRLACDVASFWIGYGRYADAAQVLSAALPALGEAERLHAQGSLARAAGALGDAAGFEAARDRVAAAADDETGKAAAALDVAHGARALRRAAEARALAKRALELAQAQGLTRVAAEAEALLGARAADAAAEPAPAAGELAGELVQLLEAGS